ncbi:MAG: PAS domain S-box protein [Crocinitomicaceae bacterium]|nr:PAS domain S-box protein [Crocinitomicaceae bacterium]
MENIESSLNGISAEACHSLLSAISAGMMISVTDERGKITWVNDLFAYYSGYARHDLIGKTHALLKSGQHPKDYFIAMWQTISSGRTWRGEICNRNANGELYWIQSTISPVIQQQDQKLQFIALSTPITERKEEETKTIASQKFVENILKYLPLDICVFDRFGTPLYVNPSAKLRMGNEGHMMSELSMAGDTLKKSMREKMIKRTTMFREALSENIEVEWVEESVEADGKKVFMLRKFCPVTDVDNNVYILSYETDITAIKESEIETRKNEERFTLAQQIAKIAHWEYDVAANNFICSEELYRIYEIDKAEGIGLMDILMTRICHDEIDLVRESFRNAIAHGDDFKLENKICLPDQREKFLYTEAVCDRNEQGIISKVWGTTHDITDRKIADILVNSAMQQLKSLAEDMNDAFIVDDVEGRIIYANNKFFQLFGFSQDELHNLQMTDYVSPEDRVGLVNRHEQRIKGIEVSQEFEYTGIKKNGEKIRLRVKVKPVYQNKHIIGTQSLIQAI